MNGLLSHLTITPEQEAAVKYWRYAQRRVIDASKPTGEGLVPRHLWDLWNDARLAVHAVNLDPLDYILQRAQ